MGLSDIWNRLVGQQGGNVVPHYPEIDGGESALAFEPGAVPTAYACINLLTCQLAALPHVVVRLDKDDPAYWEIERGHTIAGLLQMPTAALDPWQFREWIYNSLISSANAYALIRRESGRAVELIPVTVSKSAWVNNSNGGRRIEREIRIWGNAVGGAAATQTVTEADLISLHGPCFNGLASPSPIFYAAFNTLEVMATAVDHNRSALRTALAGTFLETSPELTEFLGKEDRLEFLTKLAKKVRQGTRDGGMVAMPPGVKPSDRSGLSAVDLALVELLRWSVEEICRIWQVPPRMIGHYHAGLRTESRLSTQAEDFERWSLRPRVNAIQAQLTAKLLTPSEQADGLAVRLLTDDVRAGSFGERVESAGRGFTTGILKRNEARRIVRLPPVPGGDEFLETPVGAGGGGGPPPTE